MKDRVDQERIKEIREQHVKLCKKYGLNPSFLRQVALLNSKGHNHTAIASISGINRQTVSKYLAIFRSMPQEDFRRLLYEVLLVSESLELPKES